MKPSNPPAQNKCKICGTDTVHHDLAIHYYAGDSSVTVNRKNYKKLKAELEASSPQPEKVFETEHGVHYNLKVPATLKPGAYEVTVGSPQPPKPSECEHEMVDVRTIKQMPDGSTTADCSNCRKNIVTFPPSPQSKWVTEFMKLDIVFQTKPSQWMPVQQFIQSLLEQRDETTEFNDGYVIGYEKGLKQGELQATSQTRQELRKMIEVVVKKWSKDGQSFTRGVLNDLSDLLINLSDLEAKI